MRETLILKVLFTTSVSMPEQYVAESCASTVIRSESNLATAMVMVVETLKISWNISLPATVPHSGWCLDLGDYYALRLTDYTVRQLGSNDRNFLQNFELLGRLCSDDDWCVLGRHHQVDWRSQRFSHMLTGNKDLSYKTKTWSVKGEVRAYRQFKIVKIKDMSTSVPGTHAMSLAGIELYGVLSVPYLE